MTRGQAASSATGYTSPGASEDFSNVYRAIGTLMQVVEQQVCNGNRMLEPGCTMEQFRRLKRPMFKGTSDPVEAEACITQTENVFRVLACREDQKVPFVAFMLEGEADLWW